MLKTVNIEDLEPEYIESLVKNKNAVLSNKQMMTVPHLEKALRSKVRILGQFANNDDLVKRYYEYFKENRGEGAAGDNEQAMGTVEFLNDGKPTDTNPPKPVPKKYLTRGEIKSFFTD